jgi:hypothetical protein
LLPSAIVAKSKPVTKIVDRVVGRKVHIALGAFALIIDEVQIVREARHDR